MASILTAALSVALGGRKATKNEGNPAQILRFLNNKSETAIWDVAEMDEKNKPRVKSRREKLIEILVLLLVLSIGAAILFPTGSRSKESRRRSSCQSNLKQIMLSVQQYALDNDKMYPLIASSQLRSSWAVALRP